MDFGTLLVYSCPRSCCGDTSDAYAEEVCWRQDFTQDGMGNVGKTVEAEECENEEDECSD